jgi:DNA-binding response OmpR family regulator
MPSGSQSGARILVIEDTQEFVDLVVSSLTPERFAVEVARDGQAGLDLARTFRPDVVVLDITLPVLDGIEVCRQLRTFSDAYVLMLTARDSEIDRVIGLSVGADDYLVKPFFPSELVARIKAMLRRDRGAGVAEALDVGVALRRPWRPTAKTSILFVLALVVTISCVPAGENPT